MSATIISATEANRSFSDVLNKVYYQGKTFEIKRGGEIIARVTPSNKAACTTKNLKTLFANLPNLDAEDNKSFENDLKTIRKNSKLGKNKWD